MIKSKNALFGTLNSLLLLKIKLCLDLRDIYNEDRMLKKFVVNKKGKNGGGGVAMGLRSEVIDMIKWYTVRSHIVRDRRYLVENNGFVASPGVWVLKKQIRKLARAAGWDETPGAYEILNDAQEGMGTMFETDSYWARRTGGEDEDDDEDEDDGYDDYDGEDYHDYLENNKDTNWLEGL
ncbi:hypothetical protein BDP55DRAFT_628253 [Colletotrichum godetiae]|uniref:Uncharacterized protein n=1 Tax=Colletotrichum godetiae TaxID=1209918 RepID=A0AAJ0ATT9_9PEZI|nr:uncharacterized protein BDP55DRAFT_628253 [Colletotrichum godetiae]KAK1689693.1 hypothetical protein BDP55DRAFT_628253 [Colletotrichum godetiae]